MPRFIRTIDGGFVNIDAIASIISVFGQTDHWQATLSSGHTVRFSCPADAVEVELNGAPVEISELLDCMEAAAHALQHIADRLDAVTPAAPVMRM